MSQVKDILGNKGKTVVSAEKSETVLTAAKRMNENRIGSLVVTDGDTVVGIFTERDILTRIVGAGLTPDTTKVGDVMTTPVAVCRRDTTIDEARSVMTKRRLRHLPVVEEGRLLGIITSGDVLAWHLDEHAETIQYLNEYIYSRY